MPDRRRSRGFVTIETLVVSFVSPVSDLIGIEAKVDM